jgi:hypothetical protein
MYVTMCMCDFLCECVQLLDREAHDLEIIFFTEEQQSNHVWHLSYLTHNTLTRPPSYPATLLPSYPPTTLGELKLRGGGLGEAGRSFVMSDKRIP